MVRRHPTAAELRTLFESEMNPRGRASVFCV